MKIINESDYRMIQPNINLYYFDKMDDNEKEEYLYLISSYQYFLEQYLINTTSIKEFDNNVCTSNLPFELIDDVDKDFYQFYGGQNFKYYYIRNNININALSKEEKDEFIKLLQISNGIFTDEIKEFIGKTMLKVIREEWINSKINYGPASNNFFAINGSLIIGIRYDEFKNVTGEGTWENNHDMEELFLLRNNALLEKELEEKLHIKCVVIKYNEFSVKKKTTHGVTK